MRSLLRAAVFAALLLGSGASTAERTSSPEPDVVRVFTLRHRKAEEAFLVVRPLLTTRGSLVLQPALNALTVRDAGRAVDLAARAVEAFDVPPRAFAISVALFRATTAPPQRAAPTPVTEQIRAVGARLKRLFSFTDYTALDEVVLQGLEGEQVSWNLGGSHRIDFLLEAGNGDDVVRLRNLVLARVRRDERGSETVRDVARTSINLKLREPFVLGVGREEAGSAALFLVLSAAPVGPGPGIGGLR
ncbi:MAG: hypothetical protein IPF66_02500 [Holophagales bacterium]|nr:hypothetical protein [Holophagales bacterium]